MNRLLTQTLTRVYFATPSKHARSLYMRTFCALVRERKATVSIDGMIYDLDLGEMIDLCLFLRRFEPDVTRALSKFCKEGMTVLDIGANIGAHTLQISKLVGKTGRVFAFEPAAFAYRKLKKNITLNPQLNVVALQVALSDRSARRSANFKSSWRTDGSRRDWPCLIDFVTLDEWCINNGINVVHLIKLDVDGGEYSVIAGAENLLKQQQPIIIMEVWGYNFSDASRNPFDHLRHLGYRFFDLETEEEFETTAELREIVATGSELLDSSFNVIARCG